MRLEAVVYIVKYLHNYVIKMMKLDKDLTQLYEKYLTLIGQQGR